MVHTQSTAGKSKTISKLEKWKLCKSCAWSDFAFYKWKNLCRKNCYLLQMSSVHLDVTVAASVLALFLPHDFISVALCNVCGGKGRRHDWVSESVCKYIYTLKKKLLF